MSSLSIHLEQTLFGYQTSVTKRLKPFRGKKYDKKDKDLDHMIAESVRLIFKKNASLVSLSWTSYKEYDDEGRYFADITNVNIDNKFFVNLPHPGDADNDEYMEKVLNNPSISMLSLSEEEEAEIWELFGQAILNSTGATDISEGNFLEQYFIKKYFEIINAVTMLAILIFQTHPRTSAHGFEVIRYPNMKATREGVELSTF